MGSGFNFEEALRGIQGGKNFFDKVGFKEVTVKCQDITARYRAAARSALSKN